MKPLTLAEAASIAAARGFVPEPQEPHFGYTIHYVSYLRRNWTYLSLVSYEDRFIEGAWQTYLRAFNPQRPKGKDSYDKGPDGKPEKYSRHQKAGYLPIGAGIVRTETELATL